MDSQDRHWSIYYFDYWERKEWDHTTTTAILQKQYHTTATALHVHVLIFQYNALLCNLALTRRIQSLFDSSTFLIKKNKYSVPSQPALVPSHSRCFRRVSAVGGEGGKVEVFGVTLDPLPQVTSSQSVSWDYPVASVNTFRLHNTLPVPEFLKGKVYCVFHIFPLMLMMLNFLSVCTHNLVSFN